MKMLKRKIRLTGEKLPMSKGKIMFAALMAVLLAGVLIGSVAARNMDRDGAMSLSAITDGFCAGVAENSFGEIFLSSLHSSGMLVLCCFFMGFCAVGQPIHIGVLLFRGIGLGTVIAYFYASHGFSGFLEVVILIIPGAVVSSLAIILAAREGIRFSNILGGFLSGTEREYDTKALLKLYVLKFAVLSVIILASALIDGATAFASAGF